MVRSSEPMVSLGDPDPLAANVEGKYLLLPRLLVGRHVVDKRFTPSLNIIRPPIALLSVLVEMVPPAVPVVLDSDRVQVVTPEPRTPSTLMTNAALAVAQASVSLLLRPSVPPRRNVKNIDGQGGPE